ncbi:LysR family transcriptional regulator [Vibrio sp. 10N]|uniref:LysR family transcriptional regulator n=1 Tax=Vibrio sp. 10N TaxID=3058938 RepID=UPI002813DD31|nr:LysR family transcriptional regulator [Vibrio sp. 10N]
MSKVTLEQWRMFRAVVDHGGFNQAADAVKKSPSTVHHSIQKLESILELRLLKVIGRKVVLTQAGELVLRRAIHLIDDADNLEALTQQLKSSQDGLLRVAVDQVFPRQCLLHALTTLSDLFPNANIELFESTLGGTTELLKRNEVDVAIGAYPIADRYFEEVDPVEFIAVAHPEHPLHHRDTELSLDDLIPYRQIVVRDTGIGPKLDHGWLGANQRWTVGNVSTSILLVSRGLGYAWLPIEEVQTSITNGELKPLPLGLNQTKRSAFYLMANEVDGLGNLAKHFFKLIRTTV